MLTFPQVLSLEGTTVFADDEDCNLYYLIPDHPRLVVRDGKPVFNALFWTDQADGGSGSVAGMKGAALKLDADLSVPAATRERIARAIQESGLQAQRRETQLKEERERLERMARAGGPAVEAAQPTALPAVSQVRFGNIEFLDGNVTLVEETGGSSYVAWASSNAPPSLMGDNNIAFALRLGPEGAAVWYRALEQDAAAIGIRFQLTFQVRLPSLQIHVWAGSHQKLELQRKAERISEHVDQGCESVDVARVDVKEISQKLVEEGLIHIEIVKGTAKISDDHVSQLRDASLSLISDRVKEVIQHRLHGLTEEERRSSLIALIDEEVSQFAELRLEQRDVIEWRAAPQGTLTHFLSGLSASARREHLKLVDLSDPIVSTLEVPVLCDAPWQSSPKISRVVVDVEYPAAPVASQRTATFTFGPDSRDGQTFRARRGNGSGRVSYRTRVFLEGAADAIELPEATSAGAVQVQVPLLGAFKAKLRPHPDVFAQRGSGRVQTLEVRYSYKEPGAPDHLEESRVLRATDVDGVEISHTTYRLIDAPLFVQAVYHREEPPAIEGPVQRVWVKAGQTPTVDLPLPYPDKLRVKGSVLPNIKGLQKLTVEVRYDDPDTGFGSDAGLILDADSDWAAESSLVQQRKEHQAFRYRYCLWGKDQMARSAWMPAQGDQELLLPLLAVNIHPERLGIGGKLDAAILRLSFRDELGGELAQEFSLTPGQEAPVWLIPRSSSKSDAYSYSLTLVPKEGEPFEAPAREGRGTHLFLLPPA